ncbi:MAG: amino acid permease [Acidobacteria bacterium]|jgi:amino acid transporter|nr:amino acid permease [Acidobacteriota bacterium]
MTTVAAQTPTATLDRRMGLLQASATNIISMVGIGPFLTIPLMIAAMNGPHILYAWVAGAFLSLCDGLVYAQLGAALPGSGGSYLYLREAYKPFGIGRLMAFVFIFQTILVAPLSIAGGAVGFSGYLNYFYPLTAMQGGVIAAVLCIVMTALLYRDIESIGRLTVVMLGVVLVTVGWVIVAGVFTSSLTQAFTYPPQAFQFDRVFLVGLGAASLQAMYSYGGYNQVCNIGEEIVNPTKTIPRSIVLSIVVVAVLYILMTTAIVGMIPWEEAKTSTTVASSFIARTFSDPGQARIAGWVMTVLILFVAAASLYAVILGYSRVPFAAARDGDFFKVFAKVHPRKHFPHVSLLVIGLVSLPFCFFTLGQLVNWLMQVQIMLRFVWQCGAVMLLYHYRKDIPQPWVMWAYPFPAIISLVLWLYLFFTGPVAGIIFSFAFLAVAAAAYLVFIRIHPEAKADQA